MAKANYDSTTRRAVPAGIAAAPALAAPALATGTDPIFAAMDRHRTALAAYTTATDDDQVGDAGNAHCDALANLLKGGVRYFKSSCEHRADGKVKSGRPAALIYVKVSCD
jgi:hypothetical protein